MKAISFSHVAIFALALSGCAGPVETLAGASGHVAAPLPVRVISAPDSTDDSARNAVAGALTERGYTVSPQAQAFVVVGTAERDARIAIATPDNQALSPAKHHRLLQDCSDRTQRLSIAFYAADDAEPVRAFAEEHHCKGVLADNVPSLAHGAVEQLLNPGKPQHTERWARD